MHSIRSYGAMTTRELDEARRILDESKVRNDMRQKKHEQDAEDANMKSLQEFALSYRFKAEQRMSDLNKKKQESTQRLEAELSAKHREIEAMNLKKHYVIDRLRQLEEEKASPPPAKPQIMPVADSPAVASELVEAQERLKERLERRVEEDRVIAHEMYYAKVRGLQESSAREFRDRAEQIKAASKRREDRRQQELITLQINAKKQLEMKQKALADQTDQAMTQLRRKIQRDAQDRAKAYVEEVEGAKAEQRSQVGLNYEILGSLSGLSPKEFPEGAVSERRNIDEDEFEFTVKLPDDHIEVTDVAGEPGADEMEEAPVVDNKQYAMLMEEKQKLEDLARERLEAEEELQTEVEELREKLDAQQLLTNELKSHITRQDEDNDRRSKEAVAQETAIRTLKEQLAANKKDQATREMIQRENDRKKEEARRKADKEQREAQAKAQREAERFRLEMQQQMTDMQRGLERQKQEQKKELTQLERTLMAEQEERKRAEEAAAALKAKEQRKRDARVVRSVVRSLVTEAIDRERLRQMEEANKPAEPEPEEEPKEAPVPEEVDEVMPEPEEEEPVPAEEAP